MQNDDELQAAEGAGRILQEAAEEVADEAAAEMVVSVAGSD